MDNYISELIKREQNNFKESCNTAFLFYSLNNAGGTGSYEIDYNIAEKIEIGTFYKDEYNNIYKVLSKQYDNQNNIVLICKEI